MSALDEIRALLGITATPAATTPPTPEPASTPAPPPSVAPSLEPAAPAPHQPAAPEPQPADVAQMVAGLSDADKAELTRLLQPEAPKPLNQSPFHPPQYQPMNVGPAVPSGELTDAEVEIYLNQPLSKRWDGWADMKDRIGKSRIEGDIAQVGIIRMGQQQPK